MNLSAIFTAAHAAARTATAGTYRARFAQGLRAAYAAAKAPQVKELVIVVPFSGGNANATQLATLRRLGAQGWTRSTSQFEKRMNYFDMNDAIDAARAGAAVRFVENF